MIPASCLCGAVTWTLASPVSSMLHCHCSRCRKAHGAAFATYVSAPARSLVLDGAEAIGRWSPEGGGERCFCSRCGSVVPYGFGDIVFAPAGNFDQDPGVRPELHMFVGSRAPWYEIADGLPRFEAYPPGIDAAPVADRPPLDPPGRPRGSCLCGAVTYVLDGESVKRRYCHCSRCRKALSAAHAANMTTGLDGVRFTRGEELLASYKVPEARFFTTRFCRRCGSPMPRRDPERGICVVPLGSLDDDPGVRSTGHIFVASKAPWYQITDDLPQYAEYPPGA
jgi:hypothetical protein